MFDNPASGTSRHSLELVQRIYDSNLLAECPEEIVPEIATPEVEYVGPREALDRRVHRGLHAVAQAFRRHAFDFFDLARYEVQELFPITEEVVVASVEFRAQVFSVGKEFAREEAHTWTLRDGRVARFEWGRDLTTALQAAGHSA